MLIEKTREEAIKAFLNGRKVNVLTEFEDGSMVAEPIEAILSEENTRYLVEVPAVEDPEFRQAVEDMIHGSDQNTMDENETVIQAQAAKIAKELIDSVEGEVPPPLTGPEKKEPPAGKPKKEVALELYAKGMPVREIADQVGAKYNTVYYWTHTEKKPGWNEDRHACRTCVYRATGTLKANGAGCDYADITQHIRDCSVGDCDKYIKGTPKPKKRQVKNNGKENE